MSVLKLVSLLFPFVRDMLLGESSLKYAIKTNKLRVLLLFLLMFCFGWTVYSVPRLLEMATEQVRLEHRYKALEASHSSSADTAHPINPASQAQGPIVSSQPEVVPADTPQPDSNKNDPPTRAPPVAIPSNEFKARQRSWLSSLGDGQSRP